VFGNGFLIAGGLVAAAGVTLVIIQAKSAPQDSKPSISLTPVPLRGGGGIAITFGGLP
jgi:hypothetical protein